MAFVQWNSTPALTSYHLLDRSASHRPTDGSCCKIKASKAPTLVPVLLNYNSPVTFTCAPSARRQHFASGLSRAVFQHETPDKLAGQDTCTTALSYADWQHTGLLENCMPSSERWQWTDNWQKTWARPIIAWQSPVRLDETVTHLITRVNRTKVATTAESNRAPPGVRLDFGDFVIKFGA